MISSICLCYGPCVKLFHTGPAKRDLQTGYDSKLVHAGKRYLHVTGSSNQSTILFFTSYSSCLNL